MLKVDTKAKTVTLVRSYQHPKKLLAPFEGNAQFLPNGNVFVGWGAIPRFSEFSPGGKLLFDASFGKGTAKITAPDQDADSYRAFRFVWHGRPDGRPATALSGGKLYASWNGATEVTKWQLLSGTTAGSLKPGATVAKTGFETVVPLGGATGFVAVRALGKNGRILGTSLAVRASS